MTGSRDSAARRTPTVRTVPPPAGLPPDLAIRWFAVRQSGVMSRAQLDAAGLTRHQIDGRLARGLLRSVHRGVCAVAGPPLTSDGRFLAAVLAHGGSAVLSHRSAAVLWGALPDVRGPVHVTIASHRSSRPDVRLHRSASLGSATTVRRGVPCTTVARTLVDVAAVEGAEAAERMWTTLAGRRALRTAAVTAEVERHPDRRGTAAVRRLLERRGRAVAGGSRTRLEATALSMCADHGLPHPAVNALVQVAEATYEVDLLWNAHRLIAELDDYSTHGHPDAFRTDRVRDRHLAAAGWTVIRLLWDDVRRDASGTAADLRRLLDRHREAGARS